MSDLYDRMNNFCCLSAIRNRELFKDTDYKTVYDLVDDLSILRKQLEVSENIKDYEEKHNIDLLKALSILDNGIWIIYDEGKIINRKPTLRLTDNSYWFEYDYFIYKPEDYGKTWAFTEEELL